MEDGWYYIKTWEQMENEAGLSSNGQIDYGVYFFTQEMEHKLPPHRCVEVKNNLWLGYRVMEYMVASPCYTIGEKVMVKSKCHNNWTGPLIYKGYIYGETNTDTCNHKAGPHIWQECKRYEDLKIEITCTIDGEPVKLSEISEETLLKIRKENK